MPVGTAFLILVIVIVLIVVLVVGLSYKPQLTRNQRAELKDARATLKKIEALAIRNADLYPDFAYQIKDEINNHQLKELN